MTIASRSSYSPDSRVRTSCASISFCSEMSSSCASTRVSGSSSPSSNSTLEVVQPLPDLLDVPEFGLRVGQLAGDLLRVLLVVPQVGDAGRGGEFGDGGLEPVDVHDGLDARQGGFQGLHCCRVVEIHKVSAYADCRGAPAGLASAGVRGVLFGCPKSDGELGLSALPGGVGCGLASGHSRAHLWGPRRRGDSDEHPRNRRNSRRNRRHRGQRGRPGVGDPRGGAARMPGDGRARLGLHSGA